MLEKPKVLFVGSGKLGIPSLAKIANSNELDFLGVITQEDKPAGRKLHLTPTPVAAFAESNKIKVIKIKSINSPDILSYIRSLKPDFIFLASFGQLLKSEILSIPLKEPLNLHGSLLPKYRGAAPIQAAILNGENETGVSFMRMEKGLDTGPVFARFAVKISSTDNSITLEEKLAKIASENVVDVILKIYSNQLQPVSQDKMGQASYAPKIQKHDGLINWNESAELIERKIRAYYPWPSAYTEFQIFGENYRFKIIKAKVVASINSQPGIFLITRDNFVVSCGKDALELLVIHPDGRREIKITDFIHRFHRHL
ncbi:MAG TPA: methionyl-tRNA formyltransferase [Victivallales bacterium]|nr:methionyl-tRNA formyltransferase [Victivallales bacterium]HRR27772.1 methionyl-tRNA formyltransferase [Victivallales bacterium]HRU00573.1 methionyl-tRNA formyltransferase [Victivallales bacterium]